MNLPKRLPLRFEQEKSHRKANRQREEYRHPGDDGLRSGMPVVTAKGLVGRVDAVIANAARVQIIFP